MRQGNGEWGMGNGEGKAISHSPLPTSHSRLPAYFFFALLAIFVSFSLLFAQQPRKAEVIRLGHEFELKINQEAMVEGEDMTVVFESVLEDSRCPVDVTCVWSGNAKIRLRSSKQKQAPAAVEVNTDLKPKSSSYLGYEIKLVALKPSRNSEKSIQPNEYTATLIVTKK
jgi:hypothetical protein